MEVGLHKGEAGFWIRLLLRGFCVVAMLGMCGVVEAKPLALYGSGGTTVQLIFDNGIVPLLNKKHKVAISYNAIGSGAGRLEFIAGKAQYTETDVPMSAAEESQLHGAAKLTLPFVLQTISIFVYIPNNYQKILLTAGLLAKIYQRKITRWSNPVIQKLNPTLNVPAAESIHVVYRKDSSGSTQLFAQYLTAKQPMLWKLGVNSTLKFPRARTFFGAVGSEGVAAAMRATPFSIGYLGSSIGHGLSLNEVYLPNAAGVFLTASNSDPYAAVPRVLPPSLSSWAGVTLVNSHGAQAWPITSFTYLLARKNAVKLHRKGGLLKSFLRYLMKTHGGQSLARKYSFFPIPAKVAAQNAAAIRRMRIAKGVKIPF